MAVTARDLKSKWKVDVRHALYRRTGNWYHKLERFPGALFDANGYIVFENQSQLERCPGILMGREKNWLSVPAGISSLAAYIRAPSSP